MGVTVLLDAHVFLWSLASPERLSTHAREVLEDKQTTVLVSSVSAWEIATKYRLGRLPNAKPIIDGYMEHVAGLGAKELPMTSRHALAAGLFSVDHRDPFDRMLAAQSIAEGVAVLTADSSLGCFPGLVIRW